MFENSKQKTELIIVCDKKTKEYGDFLMNLVGQNDDADGKTVGVIDGSVSAAIYSPKLYEDNSPTISCNTHILFIGSFKEAKTMWKNVICKFDKYGMKYGWLGKRAVMLVSNELLKSEEYDKFIEFSKEYQYNFEKKFTFFSSNQHDDYLKMLGAASRVTAVVAATVMNPIAGLAVASATVATNNGKDAFEGPIQMGNLPNEIKEQQYRCLTKVFYLDSLQKFLEE